MSEASTKLHQTIHVVLPMISERSEELRRSGWDFASPGAVDRGDGYTVLRKRFGSNRELMEQLDFFADNRITAWVEP